MHLSISSRKLELTDAMRSYIEKAFEQFEKYNLDIIAVKCVVEGDSKRNVPQIAVDFTIQMAHHDTVVIRHMEDDFYAACDLAMERVKKILRRYKDRIVSERTSRDVPHKVEADIPNIFMDSDDEDEIVPASADVHKPMEIAEAVEHLKATNLMFVVFNDKDNRMRVLYRRKDGKFGLY